MTILAPLKPCRKPGCNNLSRNPFCELHTKKHQEQLKEARRSFDKERGTRTERGYDNRWLRAAKAFRLENPLCVDCEKDGIIKLGDCVDHIIPHKGDEVLFWDRKNWQTL